MLYFLGPEGTFTHQASCLLERDLTESSPLGSVASIVNTVENDSSASGLVPIENSVEGVVTSTVDEILFNTSGVMVRAEVVIAVSFDGFTHQESEGVTTAISHPHALAQCKEFILRNNLRTETSSSTSDACRIIRDTGRLDAVALASPLAGPIYGLNRQFEGVEDSRKAHTKFYLLSQTLQEPRPGVQYETWVAIVPGNNRIGVLAAILGKFADRNIGIESITSRPLRAHLGAYCFLINILGWFRDKDLASALGDITRDGNDVRLLGSFPKWDGDGVVPNQLHLGGLLPGDRTGFTRNFDHVRVDPV